MIRPADEKLSTRQRILDVTLRLLNDRGPAKITTAELAAASGINEGHLYYYFKKKEHLIAVLYDAFETELIAVAETIPSPAGDPKAYSDYNDELFRVIWRNRVFFRDTFTLFTLAPALKERMTATTRRSQRAVRGMMDAMVQNGLMQATPEELDRLLANVWIVASYWMDYLRLIQGRSVLSTEHLDWGLAQVLTLYEPFLVGDGKLFGKPHSLATADPAATNG